MTVTLAGDSSDPPVGYLQISYCSLTIPVLGLILHRRPGNCGGVTTDFVPTQVIRMGRWLRSDDFAMLESWLSLRYAVHTPVLSAASSQSR